MFKSQIIGNLGRTPETRFTPDGKGVCEFSVGVKTGKEATVWVKVSAWSALGERAQQWLDKGKKVFVEGRLSVDEYTSREGEKRTTICLTASDIQFLSPRDTDAEAQPRAQAATAGSDDDNSMPF